MSDSLVLNVADATAAHHPQRGWTVLLLDADCSRELTRGKAPKPPC